MAKPWVDDTTALEADEFNKGVYGDGVNETPMILAFRVYYDGADWKIGSMGSGANATLRAEIQAGLSWDGVNYKLDIDLSGLTVRTFTGTPVVVVQTTSASTAKYFVTGIATSATDISLRFYDDPDADNHTLIDTESTQMYAEVILYGMTS